MSANFSSFPSFLLLPSHFLYCFDSRVSNFIFVAFTAASILFLLPLCVLVLYLGHQRQRQQGPASTSSSDFVTYHLVVIEMICVFGSVLYCIGVYLGFVTLMMVATHVFFIAVCGQILFYNIMCTECYLGVVHPITYLQMKQGRGIQIRNIIIWCIWLLSCAMMSIVALNTLNIILIIYFAQQMFSLVVVSFCSFSTLIVLKHRGPGEGSGDRERVDQSKQRAFHTISVITAVLLLRFVGSLVCAILYALPQLINIDHCVVFFSGFWFCLPSSLTSPLLFLHRAGKLTCFENNNESGLGSS